MTHPISRLIIVFAAITALALPAHAADDYTPHPDTVRKEGVPAGEVLGPFQWKSEIYPGTVRDYHLYIPAQYADLPADKKACVFVVQDGINRAKDWRLPETMDNLIAEGSMPVTIGIFVDHGLVPPANADGQPRFNRSFEYDSLGDRYVKFLLQEILPEVSKKYRLSDDPNDRAIGGASSGAIAAFNAAWERPDQFRRVLSTIGTYVGLRGADEMATLVRKTEPKPLRVFLQDGENDLDIYAGGWWTANQGMLAALKYAGYEVEHAWGDGGHTGKHAKAIMPDALRWLWKDYPKPITAAHNDRGRINILLEGEPWQRVDQGQADWWDVAANEAGEIFAAELSQRAIVRFDPQGNRSKFADFDCDRFTDLSFNADGNLLVFDSEGRKMLSLDSEGRSRVFAEDLLVPSVLATPNGVFVGQTGDNAIWLIEPNGGTRKSAGPFGYVTDMACSPDCNFLLTGSLVTPFVHSVSIGTDGSLSADQPYGFLHVPYGQMTSGVTAMASDHDGNIYVSNPLGIQVLDQLGRVNLIISPPSPSDEILDFCFGGPDGKTLVCSTGDAIYTRRVAAKGFQPWDKAVKPPKPGL